MKKLFSILLLGLTSFSQVYATSIREFDWVKDWGIAEKTLSGDDMILASDVILSSAYYQALIDKIERIDPESLFLLKLYKKQGYIHEILENFDVARDLYKKCCMFSPIIYDDMIFCWQRLQGLNERLPEDIEKLFEKQIVEGFLPNTAFSVGKIVIVEIKDDEEREDEKEILTMLKQKFPEITQDDICYIDNFLIIRYVHPCCKDCEENGTSCDEDKVLEKGKSKKKIRKTTALQQ